MSRSSHSIIGIHVGIITFSSGIPRSTHPGKLLPRILHRVFLLAPGSGVRIPLLVIGSCIAIAVCATAKLIIGGNFVFGIVGAIVSFSYRVDQSFVPWDPERGYGSYHSHLHHQCQTPCRCLHPQSMSPRTADPAP